MHRALCPVETLYVGQRSRAVLSCTLRGRVDVAALSAAFDATTEANPPLRSRIEQAETGPVLRLLDADERPRLITRTGDETEAYAAELNRPLPLGGPLSRAVLVSAPDGDSHLFVLVIDHTVTDGHSSIAVHNLLWDRYRQLVEGGTGEGADPQGPRWPEPVSRLLPAVDDADTAKYLDGRLEEIRRHPVELVPYDAGTGEGADADGHIEVRRLTLDADLTSRLRRTARASGVSVHALISATLLVTARRRLPGDGGARTLGCLSPVDLRSRLSPPLPASALVPAVTTHLQTVQVSATSQPLEVARAVHDRLSDFLSRGDHVHEVRITPEIPRNPALQLATVIATNMGVVPGPRLPSGLRAVDVRLVPGREHYFPQAGRSPVMACVVSFEGRLGIEFPHSTACYSPDFMRAFRDDVRAGLLAFTEADDPGHALAATG
ncbi:phthiocerol/phthiodiolone dimycocerosyl transferase family protein [Streptomyces pseudovenezuelae]|uniref:phthiocerol/phthiodiolone dimycocerosyl transferase family protein n=1 Tax=Streptomyces pseudovenezuelae TaxID=67350 RepID=UPI002E8129C0|nr:condensation domain-containing protein [Streptomyces pseudovenezuelae]WUA93756.1 condensation domain-containing protein [Streptomyces pseudovenezuelae]